MTEFTHQQGCPDCGTIDITEWDNKSICNRCRSVWDIGWKK